MKVLEAHVLVVPFPAQGHIIPILDLTHKLIASNPNLTITFLITPKNKHLISSHPSINPLILPLPPAVENAKHMPQSIVPIMLALSLLRHPITTWFHSHPSPPTLIISDMFCGWTQSLAQELAIRRLVFSPSGAFAFATTCFLWKEMPTHDTNTIVSFHSLPNSPVFPWLQISSLFRRYVKGDPDSEKIKEWYTANFHSWGLLVNSFAAFEEPYFKFLREELGHDRVWAVGPLLPGNAEVRGGASSVSVNDVVSWLDKKEDGKVVYVCFGTLAALSKDQTEAIRSALAKSGVHFIWSMRKSEEEEECAHVPCNEKGLVIRGWAPQVVILRHPAVGAFLTHCGWNSVLESVAAGVPMLAWPMTADQFVDARLLVDEFKVAKRVCEGENTVPDSDLLSRVLAESVSGSGDETRRARELKTAALDAVREGGSSDTDLRCLMERLLSPSQ